MRKTQEVIDAIENDLGKMSQRRIAEKHGVHHSYVGKVNRGLAKPLQSIERIEVPQVDPTDSRVLQLESKVIAITDERNSLKRAYKAAQRENSIFESLVDEMQNVVKPIKPLPRVIKIKSGGKKIKESCVLLLGDCHADMVVKPEMVGGIEEFDFPIALRRAEQLIESTIKFTQQTLSNYEFPTLYILGGGDFSSGDIHQAVNHSYYRNQFKNSLAIGQMFALMIRDLAAVFPKIVYVGVTGNHTRRTITKEYPAPQNSWDYAISKIAELHCKDLKNVEFLIPDSFSANIEIEGYGFCLTHGDSVKSWNSVPWYGIMRKTAKWGALNAALNRKVSYYIFNHFHTLSSMASLDGETIIGGTWLATDPFAYEALTVYGEPSQLLMGVHKDWGTTWRLPIKLRTKEENKGPRRYQVLV